MEEDVKAATLSPGEIKIEEFPYPELKEDGMIVKMEMSGLCGSDIHMFERGFTSRMFTLDFPIVPGHENVGVIEEMGAKAQDSMHLIAGEALEVGDRVTWVPVLACGQCYYCSHVYLPQFCHNGFFYGFHPVGDVQLTISSFSTTGVRASYFGRKRWQVSRLNQMKLLCGRGIGISSPSFTTVTLE